MYFWKEIDIEYPDIQPTWQSRQENFPPFFSETSRETFFYFCRTSQEWRGWVSAPIWMGSPNLSYYPLLIGGPPRSHYPNCPRRMAFLDDTNALQGGSMIQQKHRGLREVCLRCWYGIYTPKMTSYSRSTKYSNPGHFYHPRPPNFLTPHASQISKLFFSFKGWDGWTKEITSPAWRVTHNCLTLTFGDGGVMPITCPGFEYFVHLLYIESYLISP